MGFFAPCTRGGRKKGGGREDCRVFHASVARQLASLFLLKKGKIFSM